MWNNKTLQGPGFAWAVASLRRRGAAELAARHMGFFNSTPAMAPCLAAAVARMEEQDAEPFEVARFKESAAGPLAAAGDQLFWATLRPLAGLAGLVGSAFGPLPAALLSAAAYNVPQGLFRVLGTTWGYEDEAAGVGRCIGAARRATIAGKAFASVLLGLLAGALLMGFGDLYGSGGELVFLCAATGMGWLLLSPRVSPERVCVALLALSGGLSMVF